MTQPYGSVPHGIRDLLRKSQPTHQLLTPHAISAMRARGANVDTHFRDTFSTSPIQPNPTSLWAQFMYYILFF